MHRHLMGGAHQAWIRHRRLRIILRPRIRRFLNRRGRMVRS